MPQRTLNLFESATSRARVVRQGEIVQIIVDGGGAFVTFMQEFNQAKKWATPKPATGNMITDRGRFFEQIGTLVSRPGSMVSTRGHGKYVENLVRAMLQTGYDIGEWMLPPELKDLATAHLKMMPKPKSATDDKAADAAGDDRAADDTDDAPDARTKP